MGKQLALFVYANGDRDKVRTVLEPVRSHPVASLLDEMDRIDAREAWSVIVIEDWTMELFEEQQIRLDFNPCH